MRGLGAAAEDEAFDDPILLLRDVLEGAGEVAVVIVDARDAEIERGCGAFRLAEVERADLTDRPRAEIRVFVLDLYVETTVADVANADTDPIDDAMG